MLKPIFKNCGTITFEEYFECKVLKDQLMKMDVSERDRALEMRKLLKLLEFIIKTYERSKW
jgi:hypothetical protein